MKINKNKENLHQFRGYCMHTHPNFEILLDTSILSYMPQFNIGRLSTKFLILEEWTDAYWMTW